MKIQTKDVYKDFWKDKNRFDNSDYAENSPFYNKTNKKLKVICKFKDEACGLIIKEFIALRSKMYSYIKGNNENKKTAKDTKHEEYKNKLFNNEQIYHTMKTI